MHTIYKPDHNLFLKNKYTIWYYRIINLSHRYKHGIYTEKHHIIPKSLGGSNSTTNIVELSAKAHYVCHLILTKMLEYHSVNYFKMINAVMIMKADKGGNRITSRMYDILKKEYAVFRSISQSGSKNSQYNTCFVSNFIQKRCIRISILDLSSYINDGWIKMRVTNFDRYIFIKGKPKRIRVPKRKNPNTKKYMVYTNADGPYILV